MSVRKFRRSPSVARRPPNKLFHWTANLTRRPPLRAPTSLSPFAPPSRPRHAASESRVGHQISALGVLSCSGCPTASERSGRVAFARIEQSLFTAVLLNGSEHVSLRAELSIATNSDRWPATSSAARAAASVIVAAARAEHVHLRPWFARENRAVLGQCFVRGEAAVARLESMPRQKLPLALYACRRVCHGVVLPSCFSYRGAVQERHWRAAQARLASRVIARARRSSIGSRLRAVEELVGSGAETTSIESSHSRSGQRSRIATCVYGRKPIHMSQVVVRKLAVHRCFAQRGRFLMRVVESALHCQPRADSAKLAHECRSGSSDGHHPYLGTAQPVPPSDGKSHSAASATGANFIVALRSAVPASPCRA